MYEEETWVEELESGWPTDIAFPEWLPDPGAYSISFTALLEGDENPENDFMEAWFEIITVEPEK